MEKFEALNEVTKMWTWLYKHPAHDKKYYVTHVAGLSEPWKNNCPICEVVADDCSACLMTWDEQNGTFCSDPDSPFRKWQETSLDNADYRMFYAGEIIAMAQRAKGKLEAAA